MGLLYAARRFFAIPHRSAAVAQRGVHLKLQAPDGTANALASASNATARTSPPTGPRITSIEQYAIPPGALEHRTEMRDVVRFYFWTSWATSTDQSRS